MFNMDVRDIVEAEGTESLESISTGWPTIPRSYMRPSDDGLIYTLRLMLAQRQLAARRQRTRAVVREALQNAVDNGYDLRTIGTTRAVTIDLLDYCAPLEGARIEDVEPHVEEWMIQRFGATR